MTNELMTVPFHGNNLFITTVNGQPYTPMKPIVEGMGLDWRGQHEKLKANQTRWGMGIIPIPSAGGKQEAVCLPMQKLAGWLMTIQPSRVAPEIRPKIITYQNECDDALWDYWTKGTATRNGTPSQEDEPHTPTIKDFLLLNERMNQLPGAEPTAVMDATLTMIQQNTGIQVDALRRAIPTSTPKIKESINPPPTKAKELRVDGDISPNDIEAWKKFVSQPMHERLLQLHWISRNRSELAVLWTFCEHHRRTATLGEKYFRRDSRRLITSKLSDRIHCTEVGVSKSINALIEEGVLGKQEHVDNVIRKLWLNWPALAQRLKIDFPDQQVLQLNWLAQNTAELGVLSMLTQHWFDSSSMTDGVRTAPFVKVTLKTVQLHCNQLGASTNAKSIERAVTKLSESGLIELSDHGVMNKARISTTCFSAITTFLTTNFENGLW